MVTWKAGRRLLVGEGSVVLRAPHVNVGSNGWHHYSVVASAAGQRHLSLHLDGVEIASVAWSTRLQRLTSRRFGELRGLWVAGEPQTTVGGDPRQREVGVPLTEWNWLSSASSRRHCRPPSCRARFAPAVPARAGACLPRRLIELALATWPPAIRGHQRRSARRATTLATWLSLGRVRSCTLVQPSA
jgi:hypothetical protein